MKERFHRVHSHMTGFLLREIISNTCFSSVKCTQEKYSGRVASLQCANQSSVPPLHLYLRPSPVPRGYFFPCQTTKSAEPFTPSNSEHYRNPLTQLRGAANSQLVANIPRYRKDALRSTSDIHAQALSLSFFRLFCPENC